MKTHLNKQMLNLLVQLEIELQQNQLWQLSPPPQDAFLSDAPFAIDTMDAHVWLQWVFIPKMRTIIAENHPLPHNFTIHPYFEEVFKGQDAYSELLMLLQQVDELVKYP